MLDLSFGLLDCKVEEIETKTRKLCVFPFVVNGVSFNGCTDYLYGQNSIWCATKVDEDGHMYTNSTTNFIEYHGFCSKHCPVDPKGTSMLFLFLFYCKSSP